jgi:hypothetical protein
MDTEAAVTDAVPLTHGQTLDLDPPAEKIAEWLRIIHGDDAVVELRALNCRLSGWRTPQTVAGYFESVHFLKLAHRALAMSRDCASCIYMSLNHVHRDLLSRRRNREEPVKKGQLATDADVMLRRWMLVDVDPIRRAEISSTDDEKATAWLVTRAIRDFLTACDWPAPIEADSGNGYHLLYRIDHPADDGGLVQRCLKALAVKFDSAQVKVDTTVFNPSRIVTLYGTVKRKGDTTPERPHRRSKVLFIPKVTCMVPSDQLETLAAMATANAKPPPKNRPTRKPRSDGTSITDRARKYLVTLPPAVSGQRGHNATFHAACILVLGFDLTPNEAFPLLVEWNESHCQPPWEEHELRHKLEGADKKSDERGYLLTSPSKISLQRANSRVHAAAVLDGSPGVVETNQFTQSESFISTEGGFAVFGATMESHSDLRPEIDAGNHNLETITAEAWEAIGRANKPPFLFRCGGAPGRVEQDDNGEPMIRLVDEDRMRHLLARVASWIIEIGSGDNVSIEPAMPPKAVVKDVLATPDLPLPVLTRIVEAPVFAHDGTLQTEPGYHAASKTLYVPDGQFQVPSVSERPTAEEIDQARSLICGDLLVDFPFTDAAERSHAVALLLLPFARDLIPGATPLHLFEKPMPGTGATLLVDMLSYPATGRPIATMTEGRDEDEWRKRLTAKLRNSPTFLLIDNLRRRLDSGAVSAAITSPTWEDRILGQTAMLKFQVRCGWMATGNNPVVSSEMSRRIIRIRLDAKMDRPWLRTEFKHTDLRGWVRQNRGRLVWAALTLIRAWIVAGRPPGTIKLGMFEDWSEVMGGVLAVAGIPGFLSNLDKFYDESDAEGGQWRSFVAAWWAQFSTRDVKVADLFGLIGDDAALPLGDGSDQSRKVRLGQMLTQARDRMFDVQVAAGESLASQSSEPRSITLCIRRGDMKKRAYEWKLEDVGKVETQKPVSLIKDSPETHPKTHPSSKVFDGVQLQMVQQVCGESGESVPNAYACAGAHARTQDGVEKTHHTHQAHLPRRPTKYEDGPSSH